MTTEQRIPIEKIVKGNNPRTRFDPEQLQQLALSIKERGLIQPIIVEPHAKGTFLLVAGERRLEAHRLLHRKYIQAVVRGRTNHNGRERLLDAIVENDQRADVDPMDRANAYQQLRDQYHLSTRQIAQKVGQQSHIVENHLVLTRLDPEIQDLIRAGFWTNSRLIARPAVDRGPLHPDQPGGPAVGRARQPEGLPGGCGPHPGSDRHKGRA